MSGEVQLIPPGLLSFLGIKNLGQNPQRLGDAYAPVLPMVPWAFMARLETLQVGFPAASIGGNLAATAFQSDAISSGPGTFSVPANENWYVHYASIGLAPGAAATRVTALSLMVQLDSNGVAKNLALATNNAIYTNDAVSVGAQGFFLPQGAKLGFAVNIANAAATNAAGLSALITRLPI